MRKTVKIKYYDSFGEKVEAYLKKMLFDEIYFDEQDADFILLAGLFETIYAHLNEVSLYERKNVVLVYYWESVIYIGPYGSGGREPCFFCLIHSTLRHLDKSSLGSEELITLGKEKLPLPVLSPHVYLNTASLLLSLFTSIPYFHQRPYKSVLLVYPGTGDIRIEHLLPEPDCPVCNKQARMTVPPLNFSFPLKSISASRVQSLDDISGQLRKACMGKHIGIVKEVVYDFQMPFAACSAYLAVNSGKLELTLGRSSRYDRSQTIAILEALERFSGFKGQHSLLQRRSSYSDLQENALDPKSMVLHSEEQYDLPGFPFNRYRDEAPIDWVKGLNLTTEEEVWVPKCMAFYGNSPEDSFVYETSNGCAIGSSIEESILHGLLELVERDAFLITWYKKLNLTDITAFILQDPALKLLYNKVVLFTSAEITFFNSTREHGIPSVIACATNPKKSEPTTAVAAGAGLTYKQAAHSALYELGGHYLRLRHMLSQKDLKAKALGMLSNPQKIKLMEDHGLVNALPEAKSRFNFIKEANSFQTVHPTEMEENLCHSPASCLKRLLEKLNQKGFEVIAVNQTPITLQALHLSCVKVLIPHFLPMTFGFNFARLESKRLIDDKKSKLLFNEILPHPFP